MSIKTINLSYTYSAGTAFEKKALHSVDLEIREGDFFGVIGHTGSGKSTLIQHFNALIVPDKRSGDVVVLGKSTKDKKTSLKDIRSQVGMVFQYPEYQLFAETVFDDVAFGMRNFFGGKGGKLSDETVENAVRQAVSLVGLDFDEIRNRSPFELSGGQKRRVAIAGVIVTKPKILVLDEVAAGLDPVGRREIMQLIHKLKASCSPTIVLISHDMNEIARNCNRVAVLKHGEIETVTTPSALFSDEKLLSEFSLDLPETVKIARELRSRGMDIRTDLFTAEQLAQEIAHKLRASSVAENDTQKTQGEGFKW